MRSEVRFFLLFLLAVALAGCTHIDYAQRARSPLQQMRVAYKKSADFDVPPKVLKGMRPDYPQAEGLNREPGFVIIICTIGVDGQAGDFEVETMTNPAFAYEAVRAIEKWRWAPALKNGKPVPQKVRVPMTFRA
jgi:TonB family protein